MAQSILDNLVDIHTRELERVLAAYRKIRDENTLQFSDLIRDNKTLSTNVRLLDDAMRLQTEQLMAAGDQKALETHFKAKEAFLLWCMIFCEKLLFKRKFDKSTASQEAIFEGTVDGVMAQYEYIRKELKCYFELPEEERFAKYKKISVRSYMFGLANNRKKTKFDRTCKQKRIRIPAKVVRQYAKMGLDIIEEYEKFDISVSRFIKEELFIGDKKIPAKEIREFVKNGLDIVEEYRKKGITVTQRCKESFFIDNAVISINDNNDKIINPIPDPVEIIEGARKEMNAYTIVTEMKEILAYVSQSGKFSELEAEFIDECLYNKKMSFTDKHKQWVQQGVEGVPEYGDDKKFIYKFKDKVCEKLISVMQMRKKLALLKNLVANR